MAITLAHYVARATRQVMEERDRFSFDDVRVVLEGWGVQWDDPNALGGSFVKVVQPMLKMGRLTIVGVSRSTIPISRSRKLRVYQVNW